MSVGRVLGRGHRLRMRQRRDMDRHCLRRRVRRSESLHVRRRVRELQWLVAVRLRRWWLPALAARGRRPERYCLLPLWQRGRGCGGLSVCRRRRRKLHHQRLWRCAWRA
jgi:hypothetical protein